MFETEIITVAVLASFVGILTIVWLVQSIQASCRPPQLTIIVLIFYLTTFAEMVFRGTIYYSVLDTTTNLIIISVLTVVGQRMHILANYGFITKVLGYQWMLSRLVLAGALLIMMVSNILAIVSGMQLTNPYMIASGFQLRQISAGLKLALAVLFYPIWFATKAFKDTTKLGIVLLLVSSVTCLVMAIYDVITSIPQYYIITSQQQMWFFIFQLAPTLIALIVWAVLHPKRSLVIRR
ncbi:unnamed protein product [Adineta ricciae]|uniref:Integral membrane protein n=1 Tax=Adineta ricciae TaxID=249248 RepID=A0A814UEP3_ADIRI|nr:unnamed protein product [Adineta ricciae]CAF1173888.1 unnamed protein product [Adineta ricciae]